MYVQISEIFITFFTLITLEFFYAFMNCKRNQIKILKVLRKKKKCNIIKKSNSPQDMCLFISPLCPKRFSQRSHLKGFIPS